MMVKSISVNKQLIYILEKQNFLLSFQIHIFLFLSQQYLSDTRLGAPWRKASYRFEVLRAREPNVKSKPEGVLILEECHRVAGLI